MQIYIFTLGLLIIANYTFLPYQSRVRKKHYAYFSFILLGGLSALRKYTVGNDLHYQYYRNFIKYHDLPWKYIYSVKTRYEPGFLTFFKLIGFISDNPQVMIAVHSLFVVGVFIYFFYRNCDDLPIAIYLFVTMNHWFQSMVILRQMLAVCIIIIATEILHSKLLIGLRYLLFVLLVALALSMHYSAFVGLIFIIIKHIRFNKCAFIISTVAGTILFFSNSIFNWLMNFIGDFIDNSKVLARQYAYFSSQILKESKYTMSGIYSFVPYLMTFGFAGIVLMDWGVVITARLGEHRKNDRKKIVFCGKYSNDFLMSSLLIVVVAKILAFNLPVFSRFTQYFIPFEYILLGRVLKAINNVYFKRFAILAIYIFTTIAFLMMNSDLQLNARMTGTVPYKFFWQ